MSSSSPDNPSSRSRPGLLDIGPDAHSRAAESTLDSMRSSSNRTPVLDAPSPPKLAAAPADTFATVTGTKEKDGDEAEISVMDGTLDASYVSSASTTTARRPLVMKRGLSDDFVVQRPSPSYSEGETSMSSYPFSHTPSTVSSTRRLLFTSRLKRSQASQSDATSALSRWRRRGKPGSVTSDKPSIVDSETLKMSLLGYEPTLYRDHDAWSLMGLAICNIGCLPGAIFGALAAQELGGSRMLAIGWPVLGIMLTLLSATMAEMAGAFPIAGGPFSWSWRLCRSSKRLRGSARFVAWVTGSFLLCAHVLAQVAVCFQFAKVFWAFVQVIDPSLSITLWHTLAISFLELFINLVVICSPLSRSARLWRGALVYTLFVFCFIIIALLVACSDRLISAHDLYTNYTNETGWSSAAYVTLVGWGATCIATGQDAAAHMAEDTKNPSRNVPFALFWSIAGSYIFGYVFLMVLLACSAKVDILAIPSGHFRPAYIFTDNLSDGLAITVLLLLLGCMFLQDVAQLTASSRFVWAIARDQALPFSHVLGRVSSENRIPRTAAAFIALLSIPALVVLAAGSSILTSLALQGGGLAALISYSLPIVALIFAGSDALETDGRQAWTLRKWSYPIACISVLVAVFTLVLFSFPTGYPVTVTHFSWAPVTFAVVLILATLTWTLYGNVHFAGPIKNVLGPTAELPSATSHSQSAAAEHIKHTTTSADLGRSAHVFAQSTFTAPGPNGGSGSQPSSDSEWMRESQQGVSLSRFTDSMGAITTRATFGGAESLRDVHEESQDV